MKLTVDFPPTTNLENIIAYLVSEGATISEQARKTALRAHREEELLAGVLEGMRLLAAKRAGKKVYFQTANSLLDELD
jgi:hypothetical protein